MIQPKVAFSAFTRQMVCNSSKPEKSGFSVNLSQLEQTRLNEGQKESACFEHSVASSSAKGRPSLSKGHP